ncbi:MAG: hypothetical protein ABI461_01035 [Polyangiaceae bacterium]
MKARTRKVLQACAVSWCALGASAAYLGCSSDDNAALPTFDGGNDGAITLTDASNATDGNDGSTLGDGGACPADNGEAPDDLRCTGLYSDFAAKTVDPSNKAYTPGVVLWSDGAAKSRWLYLPPGTKIDDSNMNEWSFPVGTKIWKEFSFGGKKVETRFYEKTQAAAFDGGSGEWTWATYPWSADQTSAMRNDDGVADAGPNGYSIPAHSDCPSCHGGGLKDRPLGVEAIALGLPNATGETLAQLQTDGRLTVAPPAAIVHIPDDGKGSAAALGYLHMNCGVSCHNPNPAALCNGSGLYMKLSADDAFANPDGGAAAVTLTKTYTTAFGVAPSVFAADFPVANGYHRITSGDVAHSEIVAVESVRGVAYQMPPIATHLVDDAGVGLVSDWISQSP